MATCLPPRAPRRACEHERQQRVLQARRNPRFAAIRRRPAAVVTLRDPSLPVLVDNAHEIRRIHSEQQFRTDIIGRGGKVDDEAAREKVVRIADVFRLVMYQDVGERSGRVGDVARPGERVQQPAYLAVDSGWIVFGIDGTGCSRGVSRVDARLVGLIVDHQEWGRSRAPSRLEEVRHPVVEVPEDARVLLHHEQDGFFTYADTHSVGPRRVEVAGRLPAGEEVGKRPAVDLADADRPASADRVPRGLVAQEVAIEPHLGLGP